MGTTPPPVPPLDLDAELAALAQRRVDARDRNRDVRVRLKAARDAGLVARHAAKLARSCRRYQGRHRG